MSLAGLLRDVSLDTLLSLGALQLGLIVTILALCLAGIAAVIFYARRRPVYISAIPMQPFWRRRITQRVCACSLAGLLIVLLVV